MRTVDQVRQWARKRFASQCRRWLDGHGEWPLGLSLERPKRATVVRDMPAVKAWSAQWRQWLERRGEMDPQVDLEALSWPGLGEQTFVSRVRFADPATVARFAGESRGWELACGRRDRLLAQWPLLVSSGLGTFYAELSTMSAADFDRLLALLQWLEAHPRSGLYVRQLPVVGVDTKWVDRARRKLVTRLVLRMRGVAPEEVDRADRLDEDEDEDDGVHGIDQADVSLQPRSEDGDLAVTIGEAGEGGETDDSDRTATNTSGGALGKRAAGFHEVCGLRAAPIRLRLVMLCPVLRGQLGGLRDIEAPIEELAGLPIKPRAALIVENLETAHSLEDFEGGVAVSRLGNAVSLLERLPWLRGLPVLYWGDLDTFGFAILALARDVLMRMGCHVDSVMMDADTVERHLHLAVAEPQRATGLQRQRLTQMEWRAYENLIAQRWGENVRIEQERIPWPFAALALKRWYAQFTRVG